MVFNWLAKVHLCSTRTKYSWFVPQDVLSSFLDAICLPMDVYNAERLREDDETLHNRKACNQTFNRTSKVEPYSLIRSVDECILH